MKQTFFPLSYLLQKVYQFCGVLPTGLFLFFMLLHIATLLFGGKDAVQGMVVWQQTPLFVFFDSVFIILPLLFHFNLFLVQLYHARVNVHQYSYEGNWRYVLQKCAGLLGIVFLIYHMTSLFAVYFGGLQGYHYIQTVLSAHHQAWSIVLFWLGLLSLTYYFFQGFWCLLIDFGINANAMSQRLFLRLFSFIFVVCVVFEIVLFVFSVFEKSLA